MQKITFEDLPSTNTPINATNLNAVQSNVEGAFKNTQSNSTTDTYSCNYINSIVESGSNANGNWIKYSDGTMICHKKVIVENVAVTTPWEFLYEGTLSLGDWSQTFTEAPNVQLTNGSGSGFLIESFVSPGGSTTTSVGSIYIVRPNSATINVHINVLGIGKWK